MKQSLISVIIPVYNVELYLEKCVESVIKQTWKNIEIILVDDGSTDKSGLICDKLAKKYLNIAVFHQNNAGLSVARNTGLDHCNGEWVAFLDSDDWIEPEMYECLYNVAIQNHVSLSSCLSRDCLLNSCSKLEGDNTITILDYKEMIYGLQTGGKMRFEVWNKLWKRDLIGDTRFIRGQVAEDVHFDRIIFERAEKLAHINRVLHNYLISRPGNTNSSFKTARLCIFNEFEYWKNDLEISDYADLSYAISEIATNFAIDLYGNALKAKESIGVKNELLAAFRHFYVYAQKSKNIKYKRRLKYFLFNIFPESIKWIGKIYN